jgi:hypothetical protein
VSSTISPRDRVILAQQSGDQCAMPECHATLTRDDGAERTASLGVAAHIRGEKSGSARYDAMMSDDERNATANLIWICPTCHALTDAQPDKYNVATLLAIKAQHIERIRALTREQMQAMSWAELEIVAKHIASASSGPPSDVFVAPGIREKMDTNGLVDSAAYLQMGLAREPQVDAFVSYVAKIEHDFPERLASGFVQRYNQLAADGIRGDSLFELLVDFAAGGGGLGRRAAGVAVLSYLFAKCEVFDSP